MYQNHECTNPGSLTSNDSGHGSSIQNDNCLETDRIYHITSSIVHNTQSPPQIQQRRHSSIQSKYLSDDQTHQI